MQGPRFITLEYAQTLKNAHALFGRLIFAHVPATELHMRTLIVHMILRIYLIWGRMKRRN